METRRRLHLSTMMFDLLSTGTPQYLFGRLAWTKDHNRYLKRECTSVFMTPVDRTAAFREVPWVVQVLQSQTDDSDVTRRRVPRVGGMSLWTYAYWRMVLTDVCTPYAYF
ncbi:unnamed protein product [Euphydryas editha]|uniref:Uncharacterized protein n=1 Tax=Euphydryas editha TaxID=104508 RepID=A0AAU9U710_EUPED|nr:unnamed protein product [Euphydryas editha]